MGANQDNRARARQAYHMGVVTVTAVAALFLFAAGASARDISWDWDNPLPQGDDLLSVHAVSAADVFAVGFGGTILHYDGVTWSVTNVGSADLRGVWAASANDAWAVGQAGTILHYNGVTWTPIPPPVPQDLLGIWGVSASCIFVSGASGKVLYYNGSTWAPIPIASTARLEAVWCTGPNDAFVGGSGAVVQHYNGSSWTPMSTGATDDVFAIWGAASNDVLAADVLGNVFHYNGAWQPVGFSGLIYSLGISGNSTSDFYVVGLGTTVAHYSGGMFNQEAIAPGGILTSAYQIPGGSLFAVGELGEIQERDGVGWTRHTTGDHPFINDVWAVSQDAVFAVGGGAKKYNGSVWQDISTGLPSASIFGVWGASATSAFAATSAGVYQFNGASWAQADATTFMRAIWGAGENDIFAVGSSGAIVHYNGSIWDPVTPVTGAGLNGVWGAHASSVWAVGDGGTIVLYNGTSWSPVTSPTSEDLHSVRGNTLDDVYAVGDQGTVIHYDGVVWTSVVGISTIQQLSSVWARSASEVYAVGGGGEIIGYDGIEWTARESGTINTLYGISGVSGGDMIAVGVGGTILRGTAPAPTGVGEAPSAGLRIIASARTYPNPFNPTVQILVQLERAALVRVDIYDIRGAHLRTLHNERADAGSLTVRWNGTDRAGVAVPSGIYLVRIAAGDEAVSRKVVLLK